MAYLKIAAFILIIVMSLNFFLQNTNLNIHHDDKIYYCNLIHIIDRIKSIEIEHKNTCDYFLIDSHRLERPPGTAILSMPIWYINSLFRKSNQISFQKNSDSKFPHFDFKIYNSINKDVLYEETLSFSGLASGSIALTSFVFLWIGLIYNAKILKFYKFSDIIIFCTLGLLFASPIFLHNIFRTPLYPTCIIYGLSTMLYNFILTKEKPNPFSLGSISLLCILVRYELALLALPIMFYFYKSQGLKKMFTYFMCLILGFCIIHLFYNYFLTRPLFSLQTPNGNIFALNFYYIYDNIFSYKSGLLFYSTITFLGYLVFLFKSHIFKEKILIWVTLSLVLLYLLRMPESYQVRSEQIYHLIRYDINRYFTIVFPLSSIGLGMILEYICTNLPNIFEKFQNLSRKLTKTIKAC